MGEPQPIAREGEKHLPYAWLSAAAYDAIEPKPLPVPSYRLDDGSTVYCRQPAEILELGGWQRMQGFVPPDVMASLESVHLRVEVWKNQSNPTVAIAFGGTVPTSKWDWKSNFHWFTRSRHDEYAAVRDTLSMHLAKWLHTMVETGDGQLPINFRLVVTGHSLGAGLAQQLAYALPVDPVVPRVSDVIVFDPSPVTNYSGVKKSLVVANVANLHTDRIYERGEILALVRSVTNFFDPPRGDSPTIRSIRYAVFYPANPFKSHSIRELACGLSARLGHSEMLTPAARQSPVMSVSGIGGR